MRCERREREREGREGEGEREEVWREKGRQGERCERGNGREVVGKRK